MSTLSVPLTPQLEEFINAQVKSGRAANKADLVRRALRSLSEQEAVDAVLAAEREPVLKGDIRELMRKIG